MDWMTRSKRTGGDGLCIKNRSCGETHLLREEICTQSHLKQWWTQLAGGFHLSEKAKDQGGAGHEGDCFGKCSKAAQNGNHGVGNVDEVDERGSEGLSWVSWSI